MRFTNVTELSEVTQVSPTTEQTGRCYDRFWGRESGRVCSFFNSAPPRSSPNQIESHHHEIHHSSSGSLVDPLVLTYYSANTQIGSEQRPEMSARDLFWGDNLLLPTPITVPWWIKVCKGGNGGGALTWA